MAIRCSPQAPIHRDRTRVLVENVPATASPEDLGQLFGRCGDIALEGIAMNKQNRSAIICYRRADAADEAVALDGILLLGNAVVVHSQMQAKVPTNPFAGTCPARVDRQSQPFR